MSQVVNIAAYHFCDLKDQEERRERYKAKCLELELKGRILLSPEGVNVALAGSSESIESFLSYFRSEPEFKDFEAKYSYSKEQPFRRLTVKSKGHIIPFNREVKPHEKRGPAISPKQLKQWLDEKKDFVILDVRNKYETKEGKFVGSKTLPIRYFRTLPDLIEDLEPKELKALKDKTVVTVCTGGIKTEKATPWMLENGFKDVYQLEGGILKYIEEFGSEHFEGRCFVFDHRVSLDGELDEPKTIEETPEDPYLDALKAQEASAK